MISTIDILSSLSDDKALILFSTIALGKYYDFKTDKKYGDYAKSVLLQAS